MTERIVARPPKTRTPRTADRALERPLDGTKTWSHIGTICSNSPFYPDEANDVKYRFSGLRTKRVDVSRTRTGITTSTWVSLTPSILHVETSTDLYVDIDVEPTKI